MPDLLLELFSEEIPARMQVRAAEDLRKLVTDRLVEAGLAYEGAKAFVTPRRLALAVQGVPVRQADAKEEKKGPRVGAPEAAVQGFVRAAGLKSISEAKIQPDKKGDFYLAVVERPGRPAIEVIAEIVPEVVKTFPWPKSMRWGTRSLGWVRPLHSIVATFGPETEEPDIVGFSVDGIKAGDETRGHRFMAPAPFKVRRLDDYAAKLEKAKVVLDPARRKEMIRADANNLAFAQGYHLVEDAGLLDEVTGLVEWPIVLMGSFDEAFLSMPPEVIRTTIRNNQKCFVLTSAMARTEPRLQEQGKAATLANKFILVANIEAADGGAAIVAGNERVVGARLSDAKFFYETDLETRLEDRLENFKDIVFHEKLGTQWERIGRIERLAAELAPVAGADVEMSRRAARLAKADLLTEVVGEFPELQGMMGKYYALAQGEDASVASACEEHYRPLGPNDRVPSDPISIAVALADKIDTLVAFWAIDEKPTEARIPMLCAGPRSASSGSCWTMGCGSRFEIVFAAFSKNCAKQCPQGRGQAKRTMPLTSRTFLRSSRTVSKSSFASKARGTISSMRCSRSKARTISWPSCAGSRPWENFSIPGTERILLSGYKRATNIIRIEEKKDAREYVGKPDPSLYRQEEEWGLSKAIGAARADAAAAVAGEDFEAAMRAMANLRPHVDAFFDKVTVNVAGQQDQEKLRENRLRLLNEIREATRTVADFSRIEG